MDAVLSFMPEEERVQYSAMTGQSLFYMGETDLKHKILAIVEEEGAERPPCETPQVSPYCHAQEDKGPINMHEDTPHQCIL